MKENLDDEHYLDLHPLHLDAPRPRSLIDDLLHEVTDHLPLREDLGQSLHNLSVNKITSPRLTFVPRTFLKLVATNKLVECM